MRYRRVVIPGATYFFTVNLAERKGSLLVDEIDKLHFALDHVKKSSSICNRCDCCYARAFAHADDIAKR